MKQKMFLTAAALVLLFLNLSPAWSQTCVLEELDPNILWVADSSIGRIDGFAVHPNGNVFAYRNGYDYNTGQPDIELKVFEINGKTGKLIRELPKFSDKFDIESIDISDDGKYLATSYDGVIITDLTTGISKVVGLGNLVSFLPNSHKVSYRSLYEGGTIGSDSSIVILDLETNQRNYIRTEELIQKIAFSPDGRFFATGGSLYTGTSPSNTSLKLWNAQTNKLIQELERYEDQNYQFGKIQFSPDSKLVCFKGGMGLTLFNTENYLKFKHYSNEIVYDYMTSFEFITNELMILQSKSTMFVRLTDDKMKNIFEFPNRSSVEMNISKDILFVLSFAKNPYGPIVAMDVNKIMSSVIEEPLTSSIQVEYLKGTIKIQNLSLNSDKLSLKILDMQGKVIKEIQNLQIQGSNLEYRIKLLSGIYILLINDGKSEFSSKFIVTE